MTLARGSNALTAARNPTDEAAPADGHKDQVGSGAILKNLKGNRTLAGNDVRIVVGMDENPSFLSEQLGFLDALAIFCPTSTTSPP